MSRLTTKNNTVFATIPTDPAAAKIKPAARQLNAAANLYAFTENGERDTTLTAARLAHLTGCSLRNAKDRLAVASIDLTLPATQFTTLGVDDPIWKLTPCDWVVAVTIKRMVELAGSTWTEATDATLAKYAGVPVRSAGRSIRFLKEAGFLNVESFAPRPGTHGGFTQRRVLKPVSPAMEKSGTHTNSNCVDAMEKSGSVVEKSCSLDGKKLYAGRKKVVVWMEKSGTHTNSLPELSKDDQQQQGTVAAAVVENRSTGNQSPSPEPQFVATVEAALGRYTPTERAAIVRAIVQHGADEKPEWLVKQLKQPTNARSRVAVVVSQVAQWATVGAAEMAARMAGPATPPPDDRIYSKDGSRVKKNGEWLAVATPYPNQPPGGFEADAERRRQRQAETATTFNPAAMRGAWPVVPAALAAKLEAGGYAFDRDAKTLVYVDGAWRADPDSSRFEYFMTKCATPTYNETPERKAALNGTDIQTHRDTEISSLEAFTGTPGTEAALTVSTSDDRPTLDAMVAALASSVAPQGVCATATRRNVDDIEAQADHLKQRGTVATSKRLVSPGDGSTLDPERLARLSAFKRA